MDYLLFRSRMMLHATVFLYGFTAILGKLLDLTTFTLVWWRMLFAITFFLLYFALKKKSVKNISRDKVYHLIVIGFFIGIHWYCFYGAVKLSHASIALICMSLTTLFGTMLEPLLLQSKFNKTNFLIAAIIIPLMYILVNGIKDFNLWGLFIGVAAAFFAALFTILNKKEMHTDLDPELVSFYEFIGVFIFCTPVVFYLFLSESFALHAPFDIYNFSLILILSLVCTNLAFIISLRCLKVLPVFESNLIFSLEPIYGIVLAYFILNEGEFFSSNFYLAAGLILLIITLQPFVTKK